MRLKRAALLTVILFGSAAAGQAAAQAPGAWPRCIAERDGQQIGLGGSVCECRRERGGTMIGRPAGWRWSCDMLRSDGSERGVPADIPAPRRGLPPGFTYAPQRGFDSADPAEPGSFDRLYRP